MTYIELHCHSNFSLLDGADHPEDLIRRAAELEMPALALTDHDAVYGAVRFAEAARQQGIRPIFGAEVSLDNGHHLTLLIENERGWRNLCRLISRARHNAAKGEAVLPVETLTQHTAGLMALSGCRRGEIATALRYKKWDRAVAVAQYYRELFGPENFWLELQHHLLPEDTAQVEELVALAKTTRLDYVVTNNVHYASRAGQRLQDVLVCIRHLTSLARAGSLLRPNSEYYLKPGRQLAPLFAAYPQAITNSQIIADRCRFDLAYGLQELPRFPTPDGLSAADHLRHLCQTSLAQRYPVSVEYAQHQLRYELTVIEQAGLANYFLIVWDIVRFAREQGIRCQGRGSAANSLVAYLLGISPIDPLAHDLVFERFLSDERQVTPDIDLDFDAQRREAVIQYIYGRYGPEQTAMACTFVTFRKRSAVRDVARALDLPPELAETALEVLADADTQSKDTTPSVQLLLALCRQIDRFPRHLGIHNGGMIITGSPLIERIPTEPATMADRVVVQWDKEGLEVAGLVKIDILGLRMLSAIDEAVSLINDHTNQEVNLDRLTFADPVVYEMIAAGDTIGVFQVESRAQAQMLPRLQPRCLADLIVAISLIRPGPIQGNMVHPYLRRRLGQEPVTYAHPRLETALKETLGVILFQEQVLKVARDLASFTPGQGELLRRALGSKNGEAAIDGFWAEFLAGAQANGVAADIAASVFEQLRAFGGYAFAKSHAAAFAVIVYQSAWLKRYHPAALLCSLLNSQPMGFWSPAVLVGDAKRHGVKVLPVDIRHSAEKCSLEAGGVRLGFNYVAGFGEVAIDRLIEARRAGPFQDLADLCRRSRLPRRLVEHLILAGAMDDWGLPRRKLLWALGQLRYQVEELALIFPDDGVILPSLSATEEMALEHSVLGLSTGEHVMSRYRAWLAERGILGSMDLNAQASGRRVRVAGLVVVHQAPPTAKGFHFITLEDSDGLIDLILRPSIYARYRQLLRKEVLLVAEGTVQQQAGVTNLRVERMASLPRLPD